MPASSLLPRTVPLASRWAVVLSCALWAAPASAQAAGWVPFGESEATSYYLDPDSIRTSGAQRRVWRLFEYKEKQRSGVQSGKALIEIHCEEGTYRYLRTMYYAGPMGKGRYLGGVGEHKKEYIGPGTMIGQLATYVCAQAAPGAARRPASAS